MDNMQSPDDDELNCLLFKRVYKANYYQFPSLSKGVFNDRT